MATRIVRAVQTRQHELVLPWHLKWVSPLLELLPLGVRDATHPNPNPISLTLILTPTPDPTPDPTPNPNPITPTP